jgi:hypothetical protein
VELIGGDGLGEGATGLRVREKNRLLRRQDGGGLGHEVDAAKDDDVSIGLGCLVREAERVPHVVGDVLDLGKLVSCTGDSW